jgi:ABC-type phosphate transport system substrate-binding protein
MSFRKALAGASALAVVAVSMPAFAQPATTIFGGGGTLAAKLYRDVFNCYSSSNYGIYGTSPSNPTTAPYPSGLNSSCTTEQSNAVAFAYEPVGSGAGLNAFTSGNPTSFGTPATTNPVAYLNSSTTVGASATPYPEVTFAGSDAYLTAAQISAAALVDAASGSSNGIFVIPTLGTPITLPVGSVSGVTLTTANVCDIFSGQAKVGSNPNAKQQIYVRADGSGTSFIFSDFLAHQCTGTGAQGKAYAFTSANGFPSTAPSWSAADVGTLGTFTAVSGSGGVSNAIASASYSIGYLSPDYTSIVSGGPSTVIPASVDGFQPSTTSSSSQLALATVPSSYSPSIGQTLNDSLAATTKRSGYPIVGYTFVAAYGCYSSTYDSGKIGSLVQGTRLLNFLKAVYPTTATTFSTEAANIIGASGFVPPSTSVLSLFYSSGGPLSSTGINGTQCPSGRT